jgi:DHA1 family multidrug resistance protein-like MFS transporter
MFEDLGVNWAGTLLGCVALLLVPIPIIFYKYGAQIRKKSKFAPSLPKQQLGDGDV